MILGFGWINIVNELLVGPRIKEGMKIYMTEGEDGNEMVVSVAGRGRFCKTT
jgi:hypothetical protein